jgi:hypothetical protein
LSMVRVTAVMLVAKPLTQPCNAGTMPETDVELDGGAAASWTGAAATEVVVEFVAACRISATDMPGHVERR